jgi:hypothetical protein
MLQITACKTFPDICKRIKIIVEKLTNVKEIKENSKWMIIN